MHENPRTGARVTSDDTAARPERAEEFIVSPMTVGDLDEVVALEKVCFLDPWSKASFRAELESSLVSWNLVLRSRDSLAGYMIAWFVEDEAHLANIAVAPWARRKGCAQRLLNALLEEAYLRGSRIVALEVRSSNEEACRLYARNRFVPGGIRKDYYRQPREDALVMIRNLRHQESQE